MLSQFFSNSNEAKKQVPFTLKDHRDHAAGLIQKMNTSEIKSTSDEDEKSAKNQLDFLNEMLKLMDLMLKLSSTNINEKRSLGYKMNDMPKKYFGSDLIPHIEGEKSKFFAKLLAEHFEDFTKVQFSTFETQASIYASMIPLLNIRSIPDQMKHNAEVAEKIKNSIVTYNQQKRTVK